MAGGADPCGDPGLRRVSRTVSINCTAVARQRRRTPIIYGLKAQSSMLALCADLPFIYLFELVADDPARAGYMPEAAWARFPAGILRDGLGHGHAWP